MALEFTKPGAIGSFDVLTILTSVCERVEIPNFSI